MQFHDNAVFVRTRIPSKIAHERGNRTVVITLRHHQDERNVLVYLFFFDVERRFQPSLKRNGSYGDHPSIPIRHNAFVNPILTECGDTVRKVSSAVRRIKIVRNMTRPYLPMLEFDYRYAQLMKNFVADETEHRVMLDLDDAFRLPS